MTSDGGEAQLQMRIEDMLKTEPEIGYRSAHSKLKEEELWANVSLKKVQSALTEAKQRLASSGPRTAGPGENIWTAAGDGDLARVEALLDLDGFLPTSADENGYTPIHAATAWGHVELLRRLLERVRQSGGPDALKVAANVEDSDGDTPLHHLAGANELEAEVIVEVVGALLDVGADVKKTNGEGKNCLEAACTGLDAEEREEEQMDEEAQVQVNIEFVKALAARGFSLDGDGQAAAASTNGGSRTGFKLSVDMDGMDEDEDTDQGAGDS